MATWLCANKFFYKSMGDNSLTQIVPRFVYIIDKSSCYFNVKLLRCFYLLRKLLYDDAVELCHHDRLLDELVGA